MSTTRRLEWCMYHDEPIDLRDSSHEPGPGCEVVDVVVVDPDNLPPEAIQRAAQALVQSERLSSSSGWAVALSQAEAAVTAFLSDPEPGDQT